MMISDSGLLFWATLYNNQQKQRTVKYFLCKNNRTQMFIADKQAQLAITTSIVRRL